MLEFFELEEKNGYVSLYENHITINKSLMEYLKEAYRARIAIDKENNEMHIYPISKDYALSGELKESSLLQISLSKTYAKIIGTAKTISFFRTEPVVKSISFFLKSLANIIIFLLHSKMH